MSAGGVIEPIGHTKMLHDFDAGPATMCDMPFLVVNRDGKRFINESVEMSLINNYLRDAHNAGHYCQVFDSDYMTAAAKWPGLLFPPEKLKNDRKKLEAANAIDRPKTIWISLRNPPEVSPKASARPVAMMMMTAMIRATGPWIDSKMDCSGPSQGMLEPAA